jgi:FkbM family methyltransferase
VWFPNRLRIGRRSFAQFGEDLLIENALTDLGVRRSVTYIDAGAYHPIWLSNTWNLYRAGGRGVCIDPNPEACRLIRRTRRRDEVIEAAVSTQRGRAALYVAPHRGHSSLRRDHMPGSVEGAEVATVTLADAAGLLDRVDVLSLDLEGVDLAVLEATDFATFRPSVICVETPDREPFARLLAGYGYESYALTPANSIFTQTKDP